MAGPGGRSAGRVSVRVVPDATGFGTDLKATLDRLERNLEVEVKAVLDDSTLRAQLERLSQRKVEINVDVDTAGAQQQIDRASRNRKVELPVSLSGQQIVRAELIRLAANRVVDLVVNVNKRSLLAAGSALATLSGGRSATGYLTGIGRALSNLDKSVPKLALVATGIAGIGAAGLASVSGTLSLASSLVAVSGAAVSLPGLLAGVGLAGGTLAVALSTADTALAGLLPDLTKLQTAIGASFFDKAKRPITDLVRSVTGELTPAFQRLSSTLGSFAGDAATQLRGLVVSGALAPLFDATTAAIQRARGAIAPLLAAASTLVTLGSSYLPAIGSAITDVAGKFNTFVQQAASDGSLKDFIDTGIAGLKTLGSVVVSVGGIVKGLFDAANTAGGGEGLAAFAQNLRLISDAINSTGLQTALSTIFSGAIAGVQGLGAAIGPIGSLLATLAPTLAGVFETAGQTIGNVLSALAGALSQPAFANGLTSLFAGIATGVNAILPVLPVVAEAFGQVLAAVGPVAAQLGPVFAASFAAVAPAVSQVVQALTPLIPILGQALADSISVLSVALVALAPIFSAVVNAVAPLIPVLATGLTGAISALAPAVTQIVQAIGGALPAVIGQLATTLATVAPLVAQLLVGLSPMLPVVLGLVPIVLQMATVLVSTLLPAITALLPQIIAMAPLLGQILTSIAPLVEPLAQLVVALLQLAVTLQTSVMPIFPVFIAVLQSAVGSIQAVATIITAAVNIIRAVITGNFSAIPGIVSAAFSRVIGFVSSGTAGVRALIGSFVSSALSSIGQFASGLVSSVTSAMSRFGSSISSGISTAVGYFKSLAGKVISALSGLANSLYSAGLDIMRGLARGIAAGVGFVVDAIKGAVSSAVSQAKSALGIHSPSTVFRDEVGRHIPTGIQAGIRAGAADLNADIAGLVKVPQIAQVRAVSSSAYASDTMTGGGGRGVTINGDVTGTDVDALAAEIIRRLGLREAAMAGVGWGDD